MTFETLLYGTDRRIATITLNRPEKANTIRPPMPEEIERAVGLANADDEVRVIVLQGAGDSFCAGFDFSGNLAHFEGWGMTGDPDRWDQGRDMMVAVSPFQGPIPKLMSIWRSPKPVVAKIHGWCVGGGSEMALLADIVVASEDARLGTPYARVWGCHLTGMWIYRLGLTRAKAFALTGDSVSGAEAARIGLVNLAVPLEDLDATVRAWAEKLARIPVSQLAAMKLVTNQAFEHMGLWHTVTLGPILDGIMRSTPEGRAFVRRAGDQGVGAAIADRDGPFGDYSQGPPSLKPRKRGKRREA
jgi:enoyl-CoA hydratase